MATNTRALEAPLFDRLAKGDYGAKWELWEMYQPMIKNSARKYAAGDPLLAEELVIEAGRSFEKALKTYKRKARHKTFSSWLFWYLGQDFLSYTKEAKNRQTGGRWVDYKDLPTDHHEYESIVSSFDDLAGVEDVPQPQHANGRMNGKAYYHASEPIDIDNELPEFLDEQTNQVAGLLASGFTPGEIKGMVGLTEMEYRTKIDIISNYYREQGLKARYDLSTIGARGSELLDSWLSNGGTQ